MDVRTAEETLIARILRARSAGDEPTGSLAEAQNALFARHHARLSAYCARLMGDPARGEDLVQEVLETAWRKLDDHDPRRRFSSWLLGIARRKGLRTLGRMRRGREVWLEDGVFQPQSEELPPIRVLTREERHRMVRHAAEGLAPFDQEVITLRYSEGLSYKDIERILQIDRTVHRTGATGILQRCRRHLERRMRQWLVEHGHGTSFVHSVP